MIDLFPVFCVCIEHKNNKQTTNMAEGTTQTTTTTTTTEAEEEAAAHRLSDTLALLESDSLDFVVVDRPETTAGATTTTTTETDPDGEEGARACEERVLRDSAPFSDRSVLAYRRTLFAHGCPSSLRGVLWRVLLGYFPADELEAALAPTTSTPRTREELDSAVDRVLAPRRREYAALAAEYDAARAAGTWDAATQRLHGEVHVDPPRTILPGLEALAASPVLHALLCRVLVLWARRTPAVGYFQGLADLVDVLVACFLAEHPAIAGDPHRLTPAFLDSLPPAFLARVEADAFWCTTALMNVMGVCV